tara:strand:+ start:384 stop:641 length:258 start_codon:yes stop_codon:yes gene_type:complete
MLLPSQDSLHLFLVLRFLHLRDPIGSQLSVHKDTSLVVEVVETKMVDLITQVVEEAVVMEAHLVMVLLGVCTPEAVEVDLLVLVE